MNQNPPPADPTDRVMKIPPVGVPHREEALLDQAVAETFPASDPISPAVAERMEPADVQWNEKSTSPTPLSELLRRNAPVLIAIGTAVFALLALRALRGDRDEPYDDADARYAD